MEEQKQEELNVLQDSGGQGGVDKSAEKIDKVHDIEGLIFGAIAGCIIGFIVSFDVIFATEIGAFIGLIVGTRIKKKDDKAVS